MMDEMEMNEAELLAAEYALGLLTPQETAAFETLLTQDAEFRADYARWAEDFAAITDDVSPVDPPEGVMARIQDALGDEVSEVAPVAAMEEAVAEVAAPEPTARPEPPREKAQSWLQRLGLLPPALGGLAAAMAVLWLINVSGVFAPNVPGGQVTLAAADNSLVVEVAYSEDGKTLELNRTVGDLPQGQALQLWLIRDGEDPVSLGLLPETQIATLQVNYRLRDALRGASCAISVEPPGGSPTGAPTGEVIAMAPIVWS